MHENADFDVVVVGAGNAALCTALSAREQGARVLVLEKAPASEQGGNCPFTGGGFRFVHDGIADLRSLLPDLTDREAGNLSMGPYSADDFRSHLMTVTRGEAHPVLAEALITDSRPTVDWMHSRGVEWELPESRRGGDRAPSTIPSGVGLAATGGGPGMLRMLTAAAVRNWVEIAYETSMLKLIQGSNGRVDGVVARDSAGTR